LSITIAEGRFIAPDELDPQVIASFIAYLLIVEFADARVAMYFLGQATGLVSTSLAHQSMNEFSIVCQSRDDTAYVAAAIAPFLGPGDAIMLKGALAGGKTAFVQELVAALGSDADVTSPTFTLAHFYPTPAGTFLHIDAYRLSSVAEYRDLGLDDYVYESITAVEWGDIVEEDFPGSLSIDFEFVDNQDTWRKLSLSSSSEKWGSIFGQLRLRLSNHFKV
jgi:tRNA threonylcarbamoyladenosine biosynthesis protein TsaE